MTGVQTCALPIYTICQEPVNPEITENQPIDRFDGTVRSNCPLGLVKQVAQHDLSPVGLAASDVFYNFGKQGWSIGMRRIQISHRLSPKRDAFQFRKAQHPFFHSLEKSIDLTSLHCIHEHHHRIESDVTDGIDNWKMPIGKPNVVPGIVIVSTPIWPCV